MFQELIQKYFVKNTHRLTVEMKPDLSLEERQRLEEESKLSKAKESMSEQQVLEVIELTKTLKEAQQVSISSPSLLLS